VDKVTAGGGFVQLVYIDVSIEPISNIWKGMFVFIAYIFISKLVNFTIAHIEYGFFYNQLFFMKS
jgi:hypothetical protein